jgi:hypothetical protein
MFVILIGLFFFLILPKYNNFPTTFKVMSDQGVIFPLSLDIDTCGQLWVGCSAYEGQSDAKVHIVKL